MENQQPAKLWRGQVKISAEISEDSYAFVVSLQLLDGFLATEKEIAGVS